jgi:hypothetical protein
MAPIISKALIALLLLGSSALAAPIKARQLAGEGSALDSIVSDFDNASGYGTEDALDNTAQLITNTKGGSTGGTPSTGGTSGGPPPPPPSRRRRQLAGEGSALDSVVSDFDNASGYGTEDALDNTAQLITNTKGGSTGGTPTSGGTSGGPPPPPSKRQLAGEGSALDSIVSDFDNASGYGTEDALDNTAQLITNTKNGQTGGTASSGGSTGGSGSSSPPPPPPPHKRQLDKISAGVQAVGEALGVGSATAPATSAGESLDGTLTSDAANAGAQVGQTEESVLEGAGSSVPTQLRHRQLDKISAGVQAVGEALGVGSATAPATSAGESLDGTLTSDAANAGAQVGQAEESTLEGAGSSVPTHLRRRQLDKIAAGVQAVGDSTGEGNEFAPATNLGKNADGQLTSDAATIGEQVGSDEEMILIPTGGDVPTSA